MKIEIKTQSQLEGILYTYIREHSNCVIKIHEKTFDDFFYFTSSKLNNTSTLLSMCAGDVSVGNMMNTNNGKEIMEWIHDKCNYIDFSVANITLYLEDDKNKYTDLNFRQLYLKNHMNVKKTIPILCTGSSFDDMTELFKRFLNNDKCTKLVFAFHALIPDLNYTFQIDLVIDKLCVYNKTLISFTSTRADIEGYFPGNTLCLYNGKNESDIDGNMDRIFRYIPNNERNIIELCSGFTDHMYISLTRCMNVTDQEVQIYAYSNCEII